ncbi:MAG: flagellin FliC [Deltaproteobacteria bacterium]|nr:flagellin FliC [Deltaproteobacteria bacterium]
MGLRIRTNVTSLNAQRQLSRSTRELNDAMIKLASGERINKAADDAAGFAVSENLLADIRSLNMARKNALDGVSLLQTAEGGLTEASNMLIRLRELAVQAASDTIGNREREYLDGEFLQLKNELDRIANSTEFNGTYLLVGDTELPEEMRTGNKSPLDIQVNKEYFAEMDNTSNPVNIIRLDFSDISVFTDGEKSLHLGRGQDGTRVNRKQDAQQSIAALDGAIEQVSNHRALIGSMQSRLSSTISFLTIQTESLAESRSRIRDADFAVETANWTQASILQQAGTSVLAAANSQPKIALSLLQQ